LGRRGRDVPTLDRLGVYREPQGRWDATDAQGMTTPKTEEDLVTGYRSAAEECRQQAGIAATQLLRDRCLKIADEWIKLAEEAERTPSMRRN
jgi:hypothetical protein